MLRTFIILTYLLVAICSFIFFGKAPEVLLKDGNELGTYSLQGGENVRN